MFGFLGRSRRATHRFCRGNLSALIDGQLSARDQERIRRHLGQCPACRQELQSLERTVALLRRLPPARAARSFRIPASTPVPAVPLWMQPWAYGLLRGATAVATAVLVIALAGQGLAWTIAGMPGAAGEPATLLALPAAEEGAAWSLGEKAVSPMAAPMPLVGGPQFEPTLMPEEATRAAQAPPGLGDGVDPLAAPAEAGRDASTPAPEAEPGHAPLRAPAEPGGAAWPPRQRLAGYPWGRLAVGAGGLAAVLVAATLRLRAARRRWP